MIRLIFAISLLLFILVPLALSQFLLKYFPSPVMNMVPLWFHKVILYIFRIKIEIKGNISNHNPTIMIANHWSWIDIPVLGAILKARFVAKQEIEGWAIFGFLAKLQNTIFVKREDRRKVSQQARNIENSLKKGQNIILFAEGTSNDGNRVLKFKSSLFAVAKPNGNTIPAVQPVMIYYNKNYGMPIGRSLRPFFAWYGDMGLIPHLKDLFKLGPTRVTVHFGEPVFYDDFPSRKKLSNYIENAVRNSYNQSNLKL